MAESTFEQVQEDEIDLLALLLKIKAKWKIVLLAFITGLLIGGSYGLFLVKPEYTSTAKIYLRGTSASISLQDLQLGSQLTNDYELIFKSRPVLEGVLKDVSTDFTLKQLSDAVSIGNPADTRILEIKATTKDANLSANLANSVMENGMDAVLEIDAQAPYIIENAIPVTKRVNRGATSYALLGALVLSVIYCGVLTVQFIYNDTIKSSEDINQYLNLPVLTVVPEDKSERKKGKRSV